MDRLDLREAHYILPIANLQSVLARGILSHVLAEKLGHRSIAMASVQERRAVVRLPSGRLLHTYANLYVNGRNAMLYRRLDQRSEICVLRISPDVLDIDGVYISDKNAAAGWPRFEPAPQGLRNIDVDRVFAESWNHADDLEKCAHKAEMCAEILVPDAVPPKLILGAYVCGPHSAQTVANCCPEFASQCVINRPLFFGRGE